VTSLGTLHRKAPRSEDDLVGLVYELLDAHDDTARLAGELAVDERWQVHLDYLRDLQRVARASLARAVRLSEPAGRVKSVRLGGCPSEAANEEDLRVALGRD
jgi:hypothetical protein